MRSSSSSPAPPRVPGVAAARGSARTALASRLGLTGGLAALVILVSACGVIDRGLAGLRSDTGASASGEEAGATGGWVTDAAAPAEAGPGAASGSASETASEDSRMTATRVGNTEIVTYRPYLDDGSLAPGFDEHASGDSPWACRPWREGFHSCRQVGFEDFVVTYFCSTNGSTAWCPSAMSETTFSRIDNVQVFDGREPTMQVIDPAPARIEIAGMSDYVFALTDQGARTDATVQYATQDPVPLWAPTGRSAIDSTGGSWSAYRAPRDDPRAPLEPVPVKRAVLYERR